LVGLFGCYSKKSIAGEKALSQGRKFAKFMASFGFKEHEFLQQQGFPNSSQLKQGDMFHLTMFQPVMVMVKGSQFLTTVGKKRLLVGRIKIVHFRLTDL
jgi:hypothetical protein